MDMTEGERKTVRDNAQRKSEAPMYQEEMREQFEKGGISRADLPSCGEMADHHRRIIREPNTLYHDY